MSKLHKKSIQTKILTVLSSLDLPRYLSEEIINILEHLHFYKLENVLINIDSLVEYLQLLDLENTKQIKQICEKWSCSKSIDKDDLLYYLSERGLSSVGDDKFSIYLDKHGSVGYQLQKIIFGMQGMLLLNASEFCHASSSRMDINRYFWNKRKVEI